MQHFLGALLSSPPGTLAQSAKPREPCPPASVSQEKLPSNLFPPKQRLCPTSPQQTPSKPPLQPPAPHMPAQREGQHGSSSGAAGPEGPEQPQSLDLAPRGSTFQAELAAPQGSYQQLPGAPAHTLISAGLHITGLGCPALPPSTTAAQLRASSGSEHPAAHTRWGQCHA